VAAKTIQVDYLARVEGEGALRIRFDGPRASEVELRIFEPPRFFEAFLRGRSQLELPDITSRICGICPVAYMMSSCHAIEDAHGIVLDEPLRALRRLLYAGEWIESHALHVFLLQAPDLLGYPDAFAMAKQHGELVRRGLAMKKAGNAIVTVLGGRPIHPVNVRVGGFYRAPGRSELEALLPELRQGCEAAREAVAWAAALPYPELERDYEFVALRHPDEYPMCEGRIVSSGGIDAPVRDWERHFVEEQVAYSHALQARIVGRGHYLCGPLARINLNFDRLAEVAREAAAEAGFAPPCRNPFKSLLARTLEILHAFDEAVRIVERYAPPDRPFVEVPRAAGVGHGLTEAPRGSLYHRYEVDGEGLVTEAKIVPPTSQNQATIEDDLRALASRLYDLPHAEATRLAEHAVRSYDPCISCATHYLRVELQKH
jgi:coenzyme F420-reducing hydrogenase alpha subunit